MESVKTTLRVLQLVGKSAGIGVSELARQMGEPKSTIQRCLTTLYEDGWIRPTDIAGWRRWTVSMKVLTLTRALVPVELLRECARPVMDELRRDTLETIHLMVLEFDHVVFFEHVESPLALRTGRQIGARAPLHVSSAGKAILASLPKAEQAAYLKRDLEACSTNSITDPEALRRDIELTAQRGFGFSNGEFDPEVRAVAAAILIGSERPLGALSISCPATRLPDEAVPALGKLVTEAAKRISDQLAQIDADAHAAAGPSSPTNGDAMRAA
jgi:IclR family acetate operon transcriptional repressor